MTALFGVPTASLYSQLLLGLINGAFYAMLSLGLAVIFGMMNVVNFAHGAFYMLGAVGAWLLLDQLGLGYWWALVLVPLVVGVLGMAVERVLLRPLSGSDHLYGMLVTFGVALVLQGVFRNWLGSSGQPYAIPAALTGGTPLGFMFLPTYRAWVIVASAVVCLATWLAIERTKLGAYLRAATENPVLVGALGVNVPLMFTLTFGAGVALASLAGVLAAPIFQVNPLMGSDIIIVVFAVVVIGGMSSVGGSVVTGFLVGLVEGLTRTVYPQASSTVVFVVMALVLLVRPGGLFGKAPEGAAPPSVEAETPELPTGAQPFVFAGVLVVLAVAPAFLYAGVLMKAMLFALFACAFNLVAGYGRLVSFGHAMFLGGAGYVCGHAAKVWGLTPELAILAGTAAAALLGLVSGFLAIRRSGIYFAMVTLALAQMVYFVALQAPFTGGEDGLQNIPRGHLFGLLDLNRPAILYALVLAVFAGGFLVVATLVRSPFGLVLKAIREHEPRAQSLGFETGRYKLAAFTISAALSGLAGSTKAIVFGLSSLTDVYWTMSGEVLLMTFLGGVGTLYGPVAGAFLVVAMESYLAGLGQWVPVIHGAIFVVCVLVFRRGLVGEALVRHSGRRRARSAAIAPVQA